jgi:ATP-binding cassette, subfamily C, bacterial LapB
MRLIFDRTWILLLSFSANALALALPLALLQVYDRILPNQSTGSAIVIFLVVFLTVLLGATFRFLRSSVFARLSAKADHFIWMDVADRFLGFFPVGRGFSQAQKQVLLTSPAKAREVMIGQTLVPLFDAPFAAIFLVLVWFLGGNVVYGPLAIVAVSGIAILLFLPRYKRNLSALADAEGVAAVGFISQSLSGNSKGLNGPGNARLSNARRTQASISVKVEAYNNFLLDVSQSASLLALVAILAVGADAVLAGQLTTGGLAACTLLGSRGTIQAIGLFSAFARRQGANVAFHKLEALPKTAPRSAEPLQATGPVAIGGNPGDASFEVAAGEIVVLDAGLPEKTADKMAGLARAIWSNEGDAKLVFQCEGTALTTPDLRDVSRFVVARARLIEGTIIENLSRYDNDLEEEAYRFSEKIGLDALTGVLSMGYRTQVGAAQIVLSPGAIKRAALVRAFVGSPGLVLLERPGVGLDSDGIERLAGILKELSGTCSIVMTTEIPALRDVADRVIDLSDSSVDQNGAAA